MKAVIFAGGIGTRMWPASRIKTPKQFSPMVGEKSTLELMAYDFLGGYISVEDVYVATNKDYVELVKKKIRGLKDDHIFQEPAMRDLGPAVGYAISTLNKLNPLEPVAIVWSDDLVKNPKVFHKILKRAEEYLKNNPNQIVYIGQKPLFADQNKGWIHRGKAIKHFNGISMYEFKDWHYRPPLELAEKYFQDDEHAVNTGYFVSTPKFIMSLYEKFAPQMSKVLNNLTKTWGTKKHFEIAEREYPKLAKISFDDLIISRTEPNDAVVLIADLGWYGFGDWRAIKEALQSSPNDVVKKGKIIDRNSKNSLIYNYSNQLVTTIDLNGMLVIATNDVIMVCPESSVPEIKKMLKNFKKTENEKYM